MIEGFMRFFETIVAKLHSKHLEAPIGGCVTRVKAVCGLEGAPAPLPTPDSSIRRAFGRRSEIQAIQPGVVGGFEDGALIKALGQIGIGLSPARR